jgi:hypothetical protein
MAARLHKGRPQRVTARFNWGELRGSLQIRHGNRFSQLSEACERYSAKFRRKVAWTISIGRCKIFLVPWSVLPFSSWLCLVGKPARFNWTPVVEWPRPWAVEIPLNRPPKPWTISLPIRRLPIRRKIYSASTDLYRMPPSKGEMKPSRSNASRSSGRRSRTDFSLNAGFVILVLFFVVSGWISYWNIHVLNLDNQEVVRTHEVITALDDLLSIMKDAETGQRGFLITGEEKYLEPYNGALTNLDERISELEGLSDRSTTEQDRIADMKTHIHNKMQELGETIELRRAKIVCASVKWQREFLEHRVGQLARPAKASRVS